jgi:hypothetical protein
MPVLHGLLPVSLPCCEPRTFHAGSMRERRERNPCRDPIRFYAVLYTLTSPVKKSTWFLQGFSPFSLYFQRFSSIFPLNKQYFQGLFPFPETAESASFDIVRACFLGNFWKYSALAPISPALVPALGVSRYYPLLPVIGR